MLNKMGLIIIVLLVTLYLCSSAIAENGDAIVVNETSTEGTKSPTSQGDSLRGMVRSTSRDNTSRGGADFQSQPVFINSDSLTLKAQEQVFSYKGNVEVLQDDMNLKSDSLDGRYGDDNQIIELVAVGNVVITKGKDIKARSERALYDAQSQTLILSENPELEQRGSILTAEIIRIFLEEDRSVAEGEVRVRLIGAENNEKKKGNENKSEIPEEADILF